MRKILVRSFYFFCKFTGLFHVASFLTRGRLRILCYHGFVLDDEDLFRPSLFVTEHFFRRRLRYLRKHGYKVLPLERAVELSQSGRLPDHTVAITIDDGFYSVFKVALPVLREFEFPALLYVTSYYQQNGLPIFDLAIAYMCWKSPQQTVDLSSLGIRGLDGATTIGFSAPARDNIRQLIVEYGNAELDVGGRTRLAAEVGSRLGVNYDAIVENRILSLVSDSELLRLRDGGIDIGLHTHRHTLPLNKEGASEEVATNKAVIERVLGTRIRDFCYPSGQWSRKHWRVLIDNEVERATTCDSGLVDANNHPLALPRFLDDNRVSMIEFEAEISGLSEMLRRLRKVQNPTRDDTASKA